MRVPTDIGRDPTFRTVGVVPALHHLHDAVLPARPHPGPPLDCVLSRWRRARRRPSRSTSSSSGAMSPQDRTHVYVKQRDEQTKEGIPASGPQVTMVGDRHDVDRCLIWSIIPQKLTNWFCLLLPFQTRPFVGIERTVLCGSSPEKSMV